MSKPLEHLTEDEYRLVERKACIRVGDAAVYIINDGVTVDVEILSAPHATTLARANASLERATNG